MSEDGGISFTASAAEKERSDSNRERTDSGGTSDSSYTPPPIPNAFPFQLLNPVNNVDKESASKDEKKPPKKQKIPRIRIFYGTFVHSTETEPLVILDKWLLGVRDGKIVFSEPVERYQALLEQYKLRDVHKKVTISLGEGTFMVPGFIDCHTQPVDYLAQGICGPRRQDKLNMIHDDRTARKLFSKVTERYLALGTTCIAMNGSHVESANRLLSDAMGRQKQHAFVGMDLVFPDEQALHMIQMTKARDFITHIQKAKGNVIPQIIISSPLDDWLEDRVAAIHKETGVEVKLSLEADNHRDGHSQESVLQYHARHNLLSDKTIAIMRRSCRQSDLKMIRKSHAAMVFCPPHDSFCGDSIRALRHVMASGVRLGLGTDLRNSSSLSMLEAIRQCQRLSGMPVQDLPAQDVPAQDTQEVPDEDSEAEDDVRKDEELPEVTYQDFFKMATLGGAQVLGLSDQLGNFEVGKDFDAMLVDPHVPNGPLFVIQHKDTPQDLLERFIFCGDDRNITAVYISGQRVV